MSRKTKPTATKADGKPALVPKLRFPEFRGAAGWDSDALGEVADFVNEKIPLERVALGNYVSTENILPDYSGIATASKLPTTGSVTRYRPNDTLVSNIRPYLRKVWVADKGGGASNDVIVIRAKQRLLPQYFPCLLKNDAFINYVMTGAKGVKMPRGDIGSIKEYPTLYPSKPEQQKIAECLSSVDELIAAQARKLDALKTHKKGLMQQLFPRAGETQPRLRFPEFQNAGEWVEEEISKCLKKVIDYRGKAPPKSESGVPLITAKNVRFGWLDMTNDEYIEEDKYEEWMSRVIPQAGDILFTTEAPLGNVALFPREGKFALGQRLLTLRAKPDRCVPAFLFHSLLGPTMQDEIDFHGTGSTAKGIKSKVFVKLSFCHPGVQEQQRIGDCLTTLDDLIAAQTQKLETLKTHKKGLMQQLFPSPEEVEP